MRVCPVIGLFTVRVNRADAIAIIKVTPFG
jgi:hypothetical protein